MWRHTPEENLLNQILMGDNTSYTHKVLFYAQTEYLLKNKDINTQKYLEWMRVIRNIISRADLTPDGKRTDIVRSPEAFYGAINLISELANGCSDIYSFLKEKSVSSSFAKILLCVGFNRLGKDYFFFAVIAARIFAFTRARYALRRALFCSLLYCLPMELFSCDKIVVVLRFLYNVSHFSDFSNSDLFSTVSSFISAGK